MDLADGVWALFYSLFLLGALVFGVLLGFGSGLLDTFGERVDIVVYVPGRGIGGEDAVPDYGFGGGLVGFRGWVDGFQIEEDLFCVPVEEGVEICSI